MISLLDHRKLSEGLCGLVQDYGLVKYVPLAIQDRASLEHILGLSDKANGYVFARLAQGNEVPPEMLYGSSVQVMTEEKACHLLEARLLSVV